MLKQKLFYYIILIFLLIFVLLNLVQINLLSKNNDDFSNNEHNTLTPNIIHYVIFDKNTIDFSGYLSILSSIKFQKPSVLYIHTNELSFKGDNWNKILEINNSQPVITLNYMRRPTHVYGQKISSVYHASDVARILVLQQWGGIYLDTDVVILKNLHKLRQYEMVVAWPEHEYMGTQILIAYKNARFLALWLEGYQRYKPRDWYYNAGQYPTEQLLTKMPQLAHRVPELFGVQNLLNELYIRNNWTDWKKYYSVHLLSRHPPAPDYLNETLINNMNNTFKDICNYILYT